MPLCIRLARAVRRTIEVTDEYDVVHRVWRVSDPAVIASVQQQMRDRNLIIADGHHRYETALTYRNERRCAGAAPCRGRGRTARLGHDDFRRHGSPRAW